MKIENIEIKEASVDMTLSPDVIELLSMAIGHLSTSINNSSFNAGTPAEESTVLCNLQAIHEQMDSIMDNYY